jgi:Fe2+ transport system protein FeoA
MTMADLKTNDRFIVRRILLRGEIGKRMVEMGIYRGAEGQIIRLAPLGDPIEIKVLGYELSLRKSEAQGVEIMKIPN